MEVARGTACCGEGGALADACIKTDATRSTVAVGYPLAKQPTKPKQTKKRPSEESRSSWATWIRTALSVVSIPLIISSRA
ncbi:MAG: hypothetical protein IIW45_02825, partial [Alistipes sp.]|nr:hypothetical protein [Alistipes sp.]